MILLILYLNKINHKSLIKKVISIRKLMKIKYNNKFIAKEKQIAKKVQLFINNQFIIVIQAKLHNET